MGEDEGSPGQDRKVWVPNLVERYRERDTPISKGYGNGSVSITDQSIGPINQGTCTISLIDVRFPSYDGSGSVPSVTLTVCF
jgi:hypothetical protein